MTPFAPFFFILLACFAFGAHWTAYVIGGSIGLSIALILYLILSISGGGTGESVDQVAFRFLKEILRID